MKIHPRAQQLIETFNMQPHPEGGFYVEFFRSPNQVAYHQETRSALTMIYFLLLQGQKSRWHQVISDETWYWYEGAKLELLTVAPLGGEIQSRELGQFSAQSEPCLLVPAHHWQAARSLGDYSFVVCSVAPGFEFKDFTLLGDLPDNDRPRFSPETSQNEFL
jgi:uncharacterized protein